MRRTALGILLAVFVVGLLGVDGRGPGGGSLARAESDAPATNPLSGNPAAIMEGQSWFRSLCSFCHGTRADGAGRWQAADLRVFNKGFRQFVEIVKNGREVPGRAQKMPAWGSVLSDERINQIGAYLETLAREGANWRTTAD